MRRLELIFLLSASGVGYSPSAAARRDGAIAKATKRWPAPHRPSIIGGRRKARAGLVDERNREAGSPLAALKAERVALAARGRYVTELLGGGEDSERAIRWLIALMVLCCDPLAIALTAAASARRSEA
jgi:hypothetical protein